MQLRSILAAAATVLTLSSPSYAMDGKADIASDNLESPSTITEPTPPKNLRCPDPEGQKLVFIDKNWLCAPK